PYLRIEGFGAGEVEAARVVRVGHVDAASGVSGEGGDISLVGRAIRMEKRERRELDLALAPAMPEVATQRDRRDASEAELIVFRPQVERPAVCAAELPRLRQDRLEDLPAVRLAGEAEPYPLQP